MVLRLRFCNLEITRKKRTKYPQLTLGARRSLFDRLTEIRGFDQQDRPRREPA
jgi:hypothetical protein